MTFQSITVFPSQLNRGRYHTDLYYYDFGRLRNLYYYDFGRLRNLYYYDFDRLRNLLIFSLYVYFSECQPFFVLIYFFFLPAQLCMFAF